MTAEEYQQALVNEFQNATVTANIATYWSISALSSDALTYLKTRLHILDLALIGAVGKVDFKALDGASVALSDYFDHLLELRKLAAEALDSALADAGGVAVGTIAKTAPIERPCIAGPDANDRMYRGDTYRRRWPR